MAGLSDADFFGAAPPPAPSPSKGLSDADFFGAPAAVASPPQDTSLWGDIKNDVSNRIDKEAVPSLIRNAQGKDTLPETAFQLAANMGAGTVNDVAGEVGKRIPGAETVKNAMGAAAQGTANAIDSTGLGQWTGDKLMDAKNGISDFFTGHPGLAADVRGVGNLAGAEGVTAGAGAAKDMLAGAGDKAASALERPQFSELGADGRPVAPKAVQDYADQKARNAAYAEGMNANAENMKMSYGSIYDKAGEVSQGATINAPKMKNSVNTLLDDMQEDPAHKTSQGSSQAFRDLQAVSDSFDDDGNIPLDSATLLKRRLNDLYDPKMGDTRGKIYAQLNTQLNNLIKRAKVENPEWGTLMDSGNNLFNNYKNTFDGDTGANQKWSLDNKKDYEDALAARKNDPYSAPPSTDTRTKLTDLTHITSVPQYESMLRRLPPEMHDPFTQDVIAATAADPKTARVSNAIKGVYNAVAGNKISAAKNIYKAFTSASDTGIDPAMAESFPHVEDAIAHHTDVANQAYGKYMDNLQAAQNPPPGPTLALPAPDRPMTTGLYGETRPMDDTEWQAHIDKGQQAQQMGMTPDVRRAQYANQQNETFGGANAQRQAQIDAKKNTAWQQQPKSDLASMVKSASDKASDLAAAMGEPHNVTDLAKALLDSVNKGGYKRGGGIKVNTAPTPAQKMAGNYKKHHIKFHGLDIAIENPKGSERTGEGKDGKPWSSTMPDHYGYIKRTQGADGDHVDVYVGENERSNRVYVIDQKNDDGKFDEHKCMLGYPDRDAAVKAYRAAFSDKKDRIMKVTRLSIAEFKTWLKEGNTKQPLKKVA